MDRLNYTLNAAQRLISSNNKEKLVLAVTMWISKLPYLPKAIVVYLKFNSNNNSNAIHLRLVGQYAFKTFTWCDFKFQRLYVG